MNVTRYKERYNLTPNYIGVNKNWFSDEYFIFELYSKPIRNRFNVGVWHIKYK
jgi:hypothetical protein